MRQARGLAALYAAVEACLKAAHPLLRRIGYARVEPLVYAVERPIKRLLFDSQSCGQCLLGSTGMACPMNCPKQIRNGPCGGVRQDGSCELDPQMPCVWVQAWEGSQRLAEGVQKIQLVQPALNHRLQGTSAWLREARRKAEQGKAGRHAI